MLETIPHSIWTDEELLEMERQINRRHGNYQKAQYIKNEAYRLMHEEEGVQQKKGVALMEKMIELFPNEHLCTMAGHSCLGKYYRSIGELDTALSHFEQVRAHNNSITSKYGMPEMQIALTVIMLEHTDKYDYAKAMLDTVNSRTLFVKEHLELYKLMSAVLNGNGTSREVREYYSQQKRSSTPCLS